MYSASRYSASYSAGQYRTNSVNTSPLQLIVMCYDGMSRFMRKACEAIEANDIQARVKYINKTLAIVDELQNSLDFVRGGEIARNLDRVYDYFNNELMKVGMKNDLKVLAHLETLVQDLREAWAKVAEENPTPDQSAVERPGLTLTG